MISEEQASFAKKGNCVYETYQLNDSEECIEKKQSCMFYICMDLCSWIMWYSRPSIQHE